MLEPAKFQVKLSDLVYRGWFSKPIFEMIGNSKLYSDLYDAYRKFGLRLQDMRVGGLLTNPGDVSVSLSLPGNKVSILLKPDSFECVALDCFRLKGATTVYVSWDNQNFDVKEFISLGLGCLNRNFDFINVQIHSFTYSAHCFIESMSSTEYMQRYLSSTPQGLGEHVGSAVGYYFTDISEQRVSNVTLDRSRVINEGIFFRIEIAYLSSDQQATDIFDKGYRHFEAILTALNIELDRGNTE